MSRGLGDVYKRQEEWLECLARCGVDKYRAVKDMGPAQAVAGFIHIGTLNEPALERPRPDMAAKVTRLP